MSSQITAVQFSTPAAPPATQHSDSISAVSANEEIDEHASVVDHDANVTEVNYETEEPPGFSAQIVNYQAGLDAHYSEYEIELEQTSSSSLEDFDWDDLESRFQSAVGEKRSEEHDVMREIETSFQHFMQWMQVSNERESARGTKRLRTQTAFVKQSEEEYRQRQEHHDKVLMAFQQAMVLLAHPS